MNLTYSLPQIFATYTFFLEAECFSRKNKSEWDLKVLIWPIEKEIKFACQLNFEIKINTFPRGY